MVTYSLNNEGKMERTDEKPRCSICGAGDRCFYNEVEKNGKKITMCFECEAKI